EIGPLMAKARSTSASDFMGCHFTPPASCVYSQLPASIQERAPMIQTRTSIVFVAATLVIVAVIAVHAPDATAQSKTVWDGGYTQQQATRGSASFAANCTRCHSVEPNDDRRLLVGKAFWQSFRESTVDRLLDYVSKNMPNGAGGSLDSNTYADLVAFI